MNDVKKIYNRLIGLSQNIIDEFQILANLSFMNRENTEQFLDHATDLEKLLEHEKIILYNLKPEVYKELCEYLVTMDENTQVFARTLDLVCDFFDERFESKKKETIEENYEFDEDDYPSRYEDNDNKEALDIVDNYYTDEEDCEKYAKDIIVYMATKVIKNMYNRINNTYTDNASDKKFKKRLLRYFNQFKYYYFMLNNKLEWLGVNTLFDIEKIPDVSFPKTDTDLESIYYNECVTIIESLYNLRNSNKYLEGISIGLFNMMMFDEYIDYISDEFINKLIDLCNDLDNDKDYFYGNIAKSKLVKKLQKN